MRMSGLWSAELNGLFFLLEFVKEWRGGLMCNKSTVNINGIKI